MATETTETTETTMTEEDERRAEERVAEAQRRRAAAIAQKRADDDAEWAQWSRYDAAVHRVGDAQTLLGAPDTRPGTGPGAWVLVLPPTAVPSTAAPPTAAAARMAQALTLEPGDAIHYRMQEFLGLQHRTLRHTHFTLYTSLCVNTSTAKKTMTKNDDEKKNTTRQQWRT